MLKYDSELGGLTCQCQNELEYIRNCEDDQNTILLTVCIRMSINNCYVIMHRMDVGGLASVTQCNITIWSFIHVLLDIVDALKIIKVLAIIFVVLLISMMILISSVLVTEKVSAISYECSAE